MSRLIRTIIVLFFLGSPILYAGNSVESVTSLEPLIDNDEFFSETFTLFADISDQQNPGANAYFYAQIGVSNIGPGDKKGLCRMLIVKNNKTAFNQSILVDQSDWRYEVKPVPKLSVANCQLSLSATQKTYQFSGELDNHRLAIKFPVLPKKFITPFNRLHIDSGFYQSDVYIPWSKVNIEYHSNIQDKLIKKSKFFGYGYADHSRSTLLPSQLANRWLRFRSIGEKQSSLLLARFPDKNLENAQGWLWQSDKKQAVKIEQLHLRQNKPWDATLTQNKLTTIIKPETLLFRHAPLEEKGWLGKIIGNIIGNPVTYTYRASLTNVDGIKKNGILEITLSNELSYD